MSLAWSTNRFDANFGERGLARLAPWSVFACAAALFLLGLSGMARADELSGGPNLVSRQIVWGMLSLPVLILAASAPYRA